RPRTHQGTHHGSHAHQRRLWLRNMQPARRECRFPALRDLPETYPRCPCRYQRSSNYLIYWRSPRDSNPCYSLERASLATRAARLARHCGATPNPRSLVRRRLSATALKPLKLWSNVVDQLQDSLKEVECLSRIRLRNVLLGGMRGLIPQN